jgi:hypothetical protein
MCHFPWDLAIQKIENQPSRLLPESISEFLSSVEYILKAFG